MRYSFQGPICRAILGLTLGATGAWAAEPPLDQPPACQQLPGDVSLALTIRPAELAGTRLASVVVAMDQFFKPSFGFPLAEVESLTLVIVGPLASDEPGHGRFWHVRARADRDWSKIIESTKWEVQTRDGHTIRTAGDEENCRQMWFPDKRSMVFATEEGMVRALSTPDPNDKSEFDTAWKAARKQPMALLFRIKSLPGLEGELQPERLTEISAIERVAGEGRYLTLTGEAAGEGMKLRAALTTDSAEAAERVAPAAKALLKELAADYCGLIDTSENGADLSQLFALTKEPLTTGLTKLAGEIQYGVNGSTVHAEGTTDTKVLELFCVVTMVSYLTGQ